MSSDDSTVTTAALSIKERYRDPFIAMTFFAILFFIILVVIVVFWCKKRRQTEVKTVVIQPKRRQPTASTKPKPQTNGVEAQSNGHSADVEAAINTNEIELNDDSVDNSTKQEVQKATTESEVRVTEEVSNQHSDIDNEVRVDTESANHEQESDAAPQSPPSGDWQLVDKGETNPTFEKDEE